MIPPRRARELHKRLGKKAKRGFRGFPVGTVALYGPDDRRATKLVAAVIAKEDDPPSDLRRYLVAEGDVRQDPTILEEVVLLVEAHGVRSVAMVDRILGCPHEEGIDYEGPTCPSCPFWAGRARWTGEARHCTPLPVAGGASSGRHGFQGSAAVASRSACQVQGSSRS